MLHKKILIEIRKKGWLVGCKMSCSTYRLNSETFRYADEDCVEECFQKIRNHILRLKKSIETKDQQLEQLQERCERLSGVVKMQQDDLKTLHAANYADRKPKSTEKRRRSSEENHNCLPAQGNISSNDETSSASKLNMALNSEELDIIALSPNANERIAESEIVRSPRIFSAAGVRGENDMQRGLHEHNSNKLDNRRIHVAGALKKSSSSWLSKENPKQSDAWGAQFLRPKANQRKLASLSLNKKYGKDRLKQTHLQLVALPSTSAMQRTSHRECTSTLHRPAKRESTLERSKTTLNADHITHKIEEEVTFFSPPTGSAKHFNKFSRNLDCVKRSLFLPFKGDATKDDEDTASVVEIPIATQEVILLDDTTDESIANSVNDDHNTSDANHTNRPTEIKQEKIAQNELDVETHIDVEPTDEDCTEEFDVRPIVLKEEPTSAECTPTIQNAVTRLPANCADCKMYLQLYGGKKSDQEIEAHLSNCLHNMRPLTPEGFWNPLLESFPAGDPRNETLIDTRFVGKNRFGN